MEAKTKKALIFSTIIVVAHFLLHWVGTSILKIEANNNVWFVGIALFLVVWLTYALYK